MSNPAVYLLAENEIHGSHLRIEDNIGEAIHIHYGDIRMSLSIKEFNDLYEGVLTATKQLLAEKGIDLGLIDTSSLDWNWLDRYEHLESVSIKEKKINSLFTIYRIRNKEYLSKLVNIKDALFVKALCGETTNLLGYKEVNKYGQDSLTRLSNMYESIKENGYPFDNKYIMTDSRGIIYDGDHRAACLFHLYGGEKNIPVLELSFDDQLSTIEAALKDNRRVLYRRLLKKYAKNIIEKMMELPGRLIKRQKSCDKHVNTSYEGVIEWLNSTDLEYYILDCSRVRQGKEYLCDIVVNRLDKVREEFNCISIEGYPGFKMLYSTPMPLNINTSDGRIMIWDRLCCKSRFENDILPLDRFCNQYAWNHTCVKEGITRTDERLNMLYIITYSVLEELNFTRENIKYISEHKELLSDNLFFSLIEKEFFKYTCKLIEYLKQEQYKEAIDNYTRFIEY